MVKIYRTTHEIHLLAYRNYGPLGIPAGLRCRPITEGGTAGKFFLDEFPSALFAPNSFLLHDAIHYGVVLEPADVAEA